MQQVCPTTSLQYQFPSLVSIVRKLDVLGFVQESARFPACGETCMEVWDEISDVSIALLMGLRDGWMIV